MRYRLRTLITPPPFEDEEKARLASLLNVILLSALAILIVYSVVLLVTDPGDSLAFLFLSLFGVVELGLLVIMRRGHVQWVGLMLVLSAWMGLLIAGYTFGGVRGTSYTSLIVVVIIAGVLLGGQAAGVIALLSIVAGGVLWYAELTGRYAPKLDFLTPLNAWTGQAMLFILAAVLLNLADRSIRQALEQARRELAERRQTDARLRDSEERYRLISSVISDYIFFNRVGPRGELEHTWLAGAFESITGYTLEEFQALGGWRVTLHPDDVAQDERDMAGLHANQKVVTEVRIIRKEGDLRWVRVYARPLWDAEHSRLAGIYGAVQDITDRKQAEESLRRYATRMEVLHEIDRALLSAQSPQQIALATAENVRRLIGCQRVSIVLFDHQTESAHFIAVNTSAPTFLNTGQTVSFDDYGRHVIEAVERGESFVIEDVLTARVVAPADRRHLADGLRAWLCMPLFYHTELIGALNLGAATPGPFPAEQSEIAREVANQLAIAIQQNRLLAQTTEALAREQRLNEVARVISSSLDLSDTLSNIVRLAVEVVGAESGVMGLIAPDGQSLTHPYLFNLPDGLGLEQPIPKGSGIAWEVIESGQAVWLPDYRSHPSALPHWVAAGIHGFIETPLKTGDARLGILGLYQFSPQRRFDERDLALAEAVGQQAGVAIQNARLFEAERRRADEQEALRATLADLSAELEPARLLQAILERAVRLARTDIGELAIFDETTRELIVVTSYNLEKDYTGTRIALGEGTMGRVAQTRAPLIIDDYQQWERRSPQYTQSIFHAALVMPLLFGDRLLGAIGIGYLDPAQQFNPADLRLLSLFAAQAAIAIRNSQLFDAERRRIALLTALHETGLGLSAQLDLPVLLHTIVERAVRLLEARMGELYLVTPDGARLELVVNHNLLPDYIVAHLKMGEGVSGAVAATGQPLIVPDYKEWPTRIPRFAAGPYRAIISAPILWQDKVIGVFNVIDERPACFGTRDLDTMRQLAAQAAVAIQNARLFEATRRQLDELTVLQTVAMAAAESTSEDNLLEQTVQVIHQTLSLDMFDVMLWDETAGVLRPHSASQGVPPDMRALVIGLGQGIVGLVVANGQPLRVPDVSREPAYFAARSDTLSELCVPIKIGERILGVINIESHKPDAFSESDERLLMTVAGQLAPAIQRLRAEAALRTLNVELEQRVSERTAQLEAANKELESFSYSISHDLRTPLRSINGFSRILLEKSAANLDSDAQRYFQRIRDGAQRMGDLIDDLLDFSRLSRLPLHKQTINLTQIAQQVLEELQLEYSHRTVEVTIADLPPARADSALMRQVLTNLLSNAFKYSAPREPARIEVSHFRNEQSETVYFVRDNGVGFDMRYADKLYGVFQRLHREEEFEGTGVGLATVHRIIQRHGGRIWAEAEVGKGAAFYFTLGPVS